MLVKPRCFCHLAEDVNRTAILSFSFQLPRNVISALFPICVNVTHQHWTSQTWLLIYAYKSKKKNWLLCFHIHTVQINTQRLKTVCWMSSLQIKKYSRQIKGDAWYSRLTVSTQPSEDFFQLWRKPSHTDSLLPKNLHQHSNITVRFTGRSSGSSFQKQKWTDCDYNCNVYWLCKPK